MRVRAKLLILCLGAAAIVGACSSTGDPSSRAVEQYLKAMVAGDSVQTTKLACKDFEDQASKDADSFGGVKASLSGAACKKTGTGNGADLVVCTGKINATYGNEQQEFDLAGPVYSVVQQSGDWLVCGRQ